MSTSSTPQGALSRRLMMLVAALVAMFGLLPACQKYDDLIDKDATAEMKWADYEAQLQRRYDLIPNLVSTVKASAKHEEDTLAKVTEARSQAASIKLTADDLTDPAKVAAFQKAQDNLKGSLSRLMVVQEKYPDLKANQSFHDLQVQLEGTENRILRSREQYNLAARDYNATLGKISGAAVNKATGHPFKPRVYFSASTEAQAAPKVSFLGSAAMLAALTLGLLSGARRAPSGRSAAGERPGARGWVSVLLALASFLLSISALAFTPPPIQGHVTDVAGKLSASDRAFLNDKLDKYRQQSSNEIAVFLAGPLDGESIEDVAFTTFNTWKIGQKGKDNGVLLVIAPTDRKVRIETGKGVGGSLTDLQANDIIRKEISPRLKVNDFRGAIDRGTTAIMADLGGAGAPPRTAPSAGPTPQGQSRTCGGAVLFLLIIILVVVLLSRMSGGGGGGGGGFFVGGGGGGGGGWGGGGGGGGDYGGGGGESGGGGSSDSY
jgi:LemA protein